MIRGIGFTAKMAQYFLKEDTMNQTIEIIESRRSVRQYEQKQIPKNILLEIINAGNLAPSGCNAQEWRFVVIQDETTRKKLASLAMPRYKKWIQNASDGLKTMREDIDASSDDPVYYSAPTIVFVIGRGMTGPLDCPMVCQNIMLAARSLDIGSCWVFFGQLILDDEEARKMLELKNDEKVYGPILLGYPKKGFPESPEKKIPVIKWI